MNGITLAVIIIIGIIGLIILYKWLKPYFLRYDTTICIVGGLGSGKTLTATKTARVLLIRNRIWKWKIPNFFIKIHNKIVDLKNTYRKAYNKKQKRKFECGKIDFETYHNKFKKLKLPKALRKKPMLYTNYPVHFKNSIFGTKREWSKILKEDHLTLHEEIAEYSVVVIDEMPQFINQFNWNQELVQGNVNEFITFFRHYIAGYFICTAQSVDDIVVQIRRKLNQAIWCFNFRKHLFGLFYTIRMCDIILSDQVSTISTTFIEDNTKLHFGLFPGRKTYDTRCYSNRYHNIYKPYENGHKFEKLKTNKVMRLQKYISPLDDTTSEEEKERQWKKGQEIWIK